MAVPVLCPFFDVYARFQGVEEGSCYVCRGLKVLILAFLRAGRDRIEHA